MAILDQNTSRFEHRAGSTVAFLSSLVFHVGLLLFLACWMYTAGKPSRGILLSADIGEERDAALDLVPAFEIQSLTSSPAHEITAPEFSMEVDIENLLDAPQFDLGTAPTASLASISVGDVVDRLNVRSSGRGASFFGTYAHGNRFVYVLDSSRSMKGDPWTYACNQLIDSLNRLNPGQEFFVICFDMETSFLFNVLPEQASFVEIDGDVVLRVRRWLRSRTLGRATMPADALRIALEFNPDAIFFLSDGELQDNSLMMLRMLNGLATQSRQIPIHTIHLFSVDGRRTLQLIAMENGGTFTPVNGR